MVTSALRAVVCDDDPIARRVVGSVLAANGYEIVAEVDLALDALRVAEMTRPDVVVVDVALMGMSGIDVIPALREAVPECAVIVFSAFDAAREEALSAGAAAVVDKAQPDQLDDALQAVAAGRGTDPAR